MAAGGAGAFDVDAVVADQPDFGAGCQPCRFESERHGRRGGLVLCGVAGAHQPAEEPGPAQMVGFGAEQEAALVADHAQIDAGAMKRRQRGFGPRQGLQGRHERIRLRRVQEQGWRKSLAALTRAADDGLQMRAQVAPRPVGMFYGLELSFHPFAYHPSYKAIARLPLAERVARMKDPAFRAQLLSEEPEDTNPVNLKTVKAFQFAYAWGDEVDYEPELAKRIDRLAKAAGRSVDDYAYDLLLTRDGKALFYLPGANYRDGNLDAVREMLGHPQSVMGLADGGAHYGMICDGSFPTFFLTRWARDARPAQRIPLPQAIAALTSEPARLAGLNDRGRLAVGMKADINVIDFDRLKLQVPFVRNDLPAGGRRMHQLAEGYVASIVSGDVTYRNGQPTGALPGRLVRGQREMAAA